MKILITNNTLAMLGGSEWVVVELGRALASRGHQVAACSSQIGEAGSMLKEMRIPVIIDPFNSPFKPDVIHGQHHLDTMRALCAFPDVPAIYHCHGYLPWVEDPPVHPRILYYVGMSSVVSDRIRFSLGLPDQQIITVPNWVDLDRFRFVRNPPHKPRKALLYLRNFDRNSWHASQLCQAFESMSIELDLWLPQGETRAPEVVLPQYDIVFASGRSAIEAMASGCAVLPISPSACLGLVDPDNFDLFQSQNFSPRLNTGQFNADYIVRAISSYDVGRVKAVTEIVRSRCRLDAAIDALESLYARTVERFRDQDAFPSGRFANEQYAMANYIQFIMPMVRDRERLLVENNQFQQLITVKEQMIAEKEQAVAMLIGSDSMRITKPIRVISNLIRRLISSK